MSRQLDINHIFWDWHGVLGLNGFWHISSKKDLEIKKFVDYVFTKPAVVDNWMRSECTIKDLLELSNSRVSYDNLLASFCTDINLAKCNHSLLSAIKALYPKARHSIITDNMDIFEIHYLNKSKFVGDNFSSVFCSSSAGLLKKDEPGLYEYTLNRLQLSSFKNTILLDNSQKNCDRFKALGGLSILIERNK